MSRVLYTIRRDFSDALMGCCVDYCYAAGVIAANSVGLIEEYILQRIFNNKYFGENTYKTQLNNIYSIMTNERDHPFYESVHTEYV